MPVEIQMPRLSDTMDEGKIVEWKVKAGDQVAEGDLLCVIETDKADVEFESFYAGTISEIGAEPSMLKLKGSELVQAMDEVLFEAVGHWVLPLDTTTAADGNRASVGPDYAEFVASGSYHHRGYTIAGGSSEVQHNIIAKQVLGL